jgi:hypothetical protein
MVGGIDFVLSDKYRKTTSENISLLQNEVLKSGKAPDSVEKDKEISETLLPKSYTSKDSTEMYIGQVTKIQKNQGILIWGVLCDPVGSYYIQCGAFRNKSYAMRMGELIKEMTALPVGIALHNGFYKVRVECLNSRPETVDVMKKLFEKKVTNEMFIVIRK